MKLFKFKFLNYKSNEKCSINNFSDTNIIYVPKNSYGANDSGKSSTFSCSNYIITCDNSIKLRKIRFFIFFTMALILVFTFSMCEFSYGVTPKIVNKLSKAFEDIESWLIKLSTPAAAVAVGVGLFMKKFSFGDEERIRMSKKIIRGSLVSYAMLLAVNLILAAIKALID